MTPILILAAGKSSRMRGADKLLEDISGLPLIVRQVRMALATGHPVYVTLPARDHPRAEALTQHNVNTAQRVPVPDAADGLSASLRRGVAALPEGCDGVLIVLGDLPDLQTSDLLTVLNARQRAPDALIWRGADATGGQGHPLLCAAALFPQIATLKGDEGAKPLVRRAQAEGRLHVVPLPDARATTDLDTPEAWAAWRAAQRSS